MRSTRRLLCPHCGHVTTKSGIGAIYCGPHKDNCPAVRMVETSFQWIGEDDPDKDDRPGLRKDEAYLTSDSRR